MRLIRKPWIWLSRFRKRKGYGVHSPSAYSFIRGVVLETTPYYAYEELSRLHPWWVRWGGLYPLQCRRLLFRLANFAEPKAVVLLTEDEVARQYVAAAVPGAEVVSAGTLGPKGRFTLEEPQSANAEGEAQSANFVLIGKEHLGEAMRLSAGMPEAGMLVCEGIHESREAKEVWRAIQDDEHTGVTFDLYTYGVAFYNRKLHKQHYKVNF